jgi:PIN domain nuclease of toxin-antitoxin system
VTRLALDSSALVTLLLQEQGWKAIGHVIGRADVHAVMPGPVLTETVLVARRKGNVSTAEQLAQALAALGLVVVHPEDADLLRAADLLELSAANPGPPSQMTGKPGLLSLGDALILAVTERLGCSVITRDTYWKWMFAQSLIAVNVVVH